MLTALNDEGKLISLVNVPKNLAKQKLSSHYYCPVCHEHLILKVGKIRIPHFAHKQFAKCSNSTTEPESPRHLLGKKHLYHHYQRNGFDVYLEYYLPEIQQRPDLLVKKGNHLYAIEYQCSPLPRQRLMERNAGYRKLNILPIWILGTKPYKKRKNKIFELSDFQFSLCTYTSKAGLTLLSYLPEKQTFLQLSKMTSLPSTKLIGLLQEIPLEKKFPPVHDLPFDFQTWLNEKRTWIQYKVYYGNLHNDLFLKEVYTTGHNPFLLPEICGLPLPHAHLIYDSPIVWQFYIYLDCLQEIPIGQKLSLKWVNQRILQRINNGMITIREFPLDFNNQYTWKVPISEYFSLLTSLEYLSKIGEDLFMIEKKVKIPKNTEEALIRENALFRRDILHSLYSNNH
ncbi:competence protein CoiA [Lederbergia galactosidilytica]|uniref:competence protein CoiA n=1 Tax=Lederbergia galactosidilytica TaxID=217031 RepID=UPI00071705F7|nr:competence protein CoiA family protein [Lederbergia galactosidilytica]MBP1915666.1 competence CoiA-like predicted nuclease [Lederbergia galactosidilytica]